MSENRHSSIEAVEARRVLGKAEYISDPSFVVIGREPRSTVPNALFLQVGDPHLDTTISRLQGTLTIVPDESVTVINSGLNPIEVSIQEDGKRKYVTVGNQPLVLPAINPKTNKYREYFLQMPETPNRPLTQIRLAAGMGTWLVEKGLPTI